MKRRDVGWLALLAVLVPSFGGCLATGSDGASPQATSTDAPISTASATATEIPPTVTVTSAPSATRQLPSATPTLVPLCNVDDVSAFVTNFVDAFNAGDQARLDALLSDENHPYAPAVLQPGTDQHQFRGFSLRSDVVAGRDELLAELAERQDSGERWEFRDVVVDVDLDPRFEMPQVAVIGLRLTQLKGEDARYPVTGKGAVNCVDQTLLFFWGG